MKRKECNAVLGTPTRRFIDIDGPQAKAVSQA